MNIKILNQSISMVSGEPMVVSVNDSEYPIAPLVFAEDDLIPNTFKVRIMVYIPSEVVVQPTVTIVNDGEPVQVRIEGGKEVLARSILVEYVYESTSTPPSSYNLWSVYLAYSLENPPSVDYVITHLRNKDPKTSRGTVTTVQDPVHSVNQDTSVY